MQTDTSFLVEAFLPGHESVELLGCRFPVNAVDLRFDELHGVGLHLPTVQLRKLPKEACVPSVPRKSRQVSLQLVPKRLKLFLKLFRPPLLLNQAVVSNVRTVHELPEISGRSVDPLEIVRQSVEEGSFVGDCGYVPIRGKVEEFAAQFDVEENLPDQAQRNPWRTDSSLAL